MTTTRFLAFALAPLLLAGCSRSMLERGSSGPRWQEDGRNARDLPTMFLADTTIRSTRATPGCTSPLVDPRDGTKLMLVRSQQVGGDLTPTTSRSPTRDVVPTSPPGHNTFRGDYAVEAVGRYGMAANELLRIDCVTGRGLGIVSNGR